MDRSSPIGVFDSGVGGLTVLKALMERLPHEGTIYLGDTARVPYGTKSADTVTRYALRCAELLMRDGIKALVVACNTASAVALPALRKALDIPVIDVIAPGAQAAAAQSTAGRVAVIGTPGTIASGAYQAALLGERKELSVRARACPLFVPLAEEGWTSGEVPRLVAQEYLGGGFLDGADTLVLGCTHYPLLAAVIQQAAGPGVTLIDSAHATAERTAQLLEGLGLFAASRAPAQRQYLVTDVPARFLEVGARFLGHPLEGARQVDL
jgi:glutamate racemase